MSQFQTAIYRLSKHLFTSFFHSYFFFHWSWAWNIEKIKIASFWYPYSFTKCVRNLIVSRWYPVVKSTTGYVVFIRSTQNRSILLHWDLLLPWEWKKFNSLKYMALVGGPKWRVKFVYPKIVLIFSNIFIFDLQKGVYITIRSRMLF